RRKPAQGHDRDGGLPAARYSDRNRRAAPAAAQGRDPQARRKVRRVRGARRRGVRDRSRARRRNRRRRDREVRRGERRPGRQQQPRHAAGWYNHMGGRRGRRVMAKRLVEIRALRKTYDTGETKVTPLDNINLDIAEGEFL